MLSLSIYACLSCGTLVTGQDVGNLVGPGHVLHGRLHERSHQQDHQVDGGLREAPQRRQARGTHTQTTRDLFFRFAFAVFPTFVELVV